MTVKPEQMLVISPPAHFRWGAETHVGMDRQENQDNFFADPEPALFLVSDGMGATGAAPSHRESSPRTCP